MITEFVGKNTWTIGQIFRVNWILKSLSTTRIRYSSRSFPSQCENTACSKIIGESTEEDLFSVSQDCNYHLTLIIILRSNAPHRCIISYFLPRYCLFISEFDDARFGTFLPVIHLFQLHCFILPFLPLLLIKSLSLPTYKVWVGGTNPNTYVITKIELKWFQF